MLREALWWVICSYIPMKLKNAALTCGICMDTLYIEYGCDFCQSHSPVHPDNNSQMPLRCPLLVLMPSVMCSRYICDTVDRGMLNACTTLVIKCHSHYHATIKLKSFMSLCLDHAGQHLSAYTGLGVLWPSHLLYQCIYIYIYSTKSSASASSLSTRLILLAHEGC